MRGDSSPLPRRTLLRTGAAAVALPFLEAMTPMRGASASRRTRLVAIEMVHGAAGSTEYGRSRNLWSPAAVGDRFELTPTLRSLEPFRDRLTIVSNTELGGAEPHSPAEEGDMVDHARSSAAFLTGAHPVRKATGEVECGPSLDQLYARRAGAQTPIRSLELSVEGLRDAPDLSWPVGYSPAYHQAISWIDAWTPALPEARMSAVFARLFGAPPSTDPGAGSLLDGVSPQVRRLRRRLSLTDRVRVEAHLAEVRDLERRIALFERAQEDREPPNPSFVEQVRILSDLVVLAFASDLTRVCSLKLGLDRSQRIYAESGVRTPFHTASHHREDPERILEFARLNAFHVQQIAYLLHRLNETADDGQPLLDRSLVLYGSPMGDSHVHAHTFLPVFLAGRADGAIQGNRHVICEPGVPFANLLLTVARRLDLPLERLGESTGEIAI